MKHFFVFGLPRSRTAWFANFLTTDKSFCFHEALGFGGWEERLGGVDREYVGVAEPSPLSYPAVKEMFPDARFLFIRREPMECSLSMARIWGDVDLKAFMDDAEAVMDSADEMQLYFDELTEKNLVRAWEHLLPGLPIDMRRTRQQMLFNVRANVFSPEGMSKHILASAEVA